MQAHLHIGENDQSGQICSPCYLSGKPFYLGLSLNPPTLHLPDLLSKSRAVPGENVGYTKNKF